MMQELLHGEENEAYGDNGYTDADKREEAVVRNSKGKQIKYKINRKPSQIKKRSICGKEIRVQKVIVRLKVEHVFAVVKRQLGYR